MVNKCSAIGCKSLYIKSGKNVKLHRFPLTNNETLPAWIAATGRETEWKPCKSSRLCGNHFQETEYIVGHGKGVLKSTAIPTIDYRIDIPKYQKKKCLNSHISKLIKVETTENDIEIGQTYSNDILYNSKYEQNEHTNYDYGESYNTAEYSGIQNNQVFIKNYNSIKYENDEYYDENTTFNTSQENSIEQIKKELCNTENQCIMFSSSVIEDKKQEEKMIIAPPDKLSLVDSSSMNIDQSTADSNFNKIMSLKLRNQRRTKDIYSLYFRTMTKNNVLRTETMPLKLFNDDTATFGAFIEAQMKELQPYQNVYLATKYKIQKLLMKAQLKITRQSI